MTPWGKRHAVDPTCLRTGVNEEGSWTTGLLTRSFRWLPTATFETDGRHFSPMQVHSAIRWRWPWLTDPEDARRVFDTADELAALGLLEERPSRSGLDLYTDYRITDAGSAPA